MEELKYNPNTGELLTDRTWNYFVPLATDIPTIFNVYFRKKSYSCDAILGSKGMLLSFFLIHNIFSIFKILNIYFKPNAKRVFLRLIFI